MFTIKIAGNRNEEWSYYSADRLKVFGNVNVQKPKGSNFVANILNEPSPEPSEGSALSTTTNNLICTDEQLEKICTEKGCDGFVMLSLLSYINGDPENLLRKEVLVSRRKGRDHLRQIFIMQNGKTIDKIN